MKIAKAFVYSLDLPVNAEVESIVVGPFDGGESYLDVVVKLVTDTGICGYGEVSFSSGSLLAFTANSAAQSSAQTHIHSAIVVIDTSNNA